MSAGRVAGMLSGSLASSLKERSSSVRLEHRPRLWPRTSVSRTFLWRFTDSREQEAVEAEALEEGGGEEVSPTGETRERKRRRRLA